MTVADIYRIYGLNTGGLILIGGLDPTKFQDAQGFNNYFRNPYDPSRPEVIPLANITEYNAVLNADGYLDVTMRVNTLFEIPLAVFSNYGTRGSGSQITYYIDIEGYTQGLGIRNLANQYQMNHFYVKGIKELGSQWNRNVNIDYLDFEGVEVLGDYYFHNMRFGMERLNIRNASILEAGQDPARDTVFYNFNEYQSNKRNVIYAHPNMATINNGGVLDTLQTAISRGVDVRFVSDTSNIPANVSDLSFEVVGGTYVKLAFTDIVDADFYEVWLKDYSDPDNVILRYFLYSEITNANKYVSGLKENTKYDIRVRAVDVNYNKGEFSDWEQVDTEAQDAAVITQSNIGGTYIEMIIDNYADLSQIYNITNIEVYVDNVLNQTIAPTDKALITNLTELTSYDVSVKIITDTITLSSNTLTATTMQIPALFTNGVAYWKQNELQGNTIDWIKDHKGTLNGTINRDGDWYDYGTNGGYVEVADSDDFSFTDGASATDFVIRTTVIFDGFNSNNRAWLVSKRATEPTDRDWQLIFTGGKFVFSIWDDSNNKVQIDYSSFTPTIGQKYILGATLNGNELSLFIDGAIVATQTITATNFANSTSPVKLGNETFSFDLNLVGRQKETFIKKGGGWTAGQISDDFNNGQGTNY